MHINLSGSIALVTGSSGGIGRAVALMLARSGAKVALNYLNSKESAEEAVAEIRGFGGEAHAFRADVTHVEQAEALVSEVEKAFGGPVTILVNNAGHLVQRLSNAEMTEELYNKVMDVNMKSTVFVSKAVIQGMKAAGTGRIVNMTSVAAHNGGGPGSEYLCSQQGGCPQLHQRAGEGACFQRNPCECRIARLYRTNGVSCCFYPG